MRLALILFTACAPSLLPNTSFLTEASFATAQERILVLGADGLTVQRLDGRERRLLIEGRGCALVGGTPSQIVVRCGAASWLVERNGVHPLAHDAPGTARSARVSGCTNGAHSCICSDRWHPEADGDRLLWRHEAGDSRLLAKTGAPVQDPFVSEDCQVVGFHSGGKVYLVHLRSGRVGLLAVGETLRWPE